MVTSARPLTLIFFGVVLALTVIASAPRADAGGDPPALQPPFDEDYLFTNVGALPELLDFLGPIVFPPGDSDTLIYGTSANSDDTGVLNSIAVVRDGNGHITGFSGDPTFVANADGNDGGADFAPNGTLFVTTYGATVGNRILEYKPGSTDPDKMIDLSTIGVTGSTGALRFVPAGFDGAGSLKVTDYSDDAWYTVPFVENGSGTYDLGAASLDAQFADETGPESPVYVRSGPEFSQDSILQAEFDTGEVAAYFAGTSGDPLTNGTRRIFIAGEAFAPVGMTRDPLTGDLLIGDYYTGEIFVIQGFQIFPRKGDLNCDGATSTLDVVTFFRNEIDAPLGLPPGCPMIGGGYPQFQAAGADNIVGDMNCDGELSAIDGLYLLKHAGGLPNEFPSGCVNIGGL